MSKLTTEEQALVQTLEAKRRLTISAAALEQAVVQALDDGEIDHVAGGAGMNRVVPCPHIFNE